MALFAWAVLLMALSGAQHKTDNFVEVQMLITSGEEPPSWEIRSAPDLSKLKRSLTDLPSAPARNPVALGWQGWLLVNHGVSGMPDQLELFDGVICISANGHKRYFEDRRKLAVWLESEAKRRHVLK